MSGKNTISLEGLNGRNICFGVRDQVFEPRVANETLFREWCQVQAAHNLLKCSLDPLHML